MRKKLKSDKAPVGAISIARNFEGKAKEKGITLVALIITIIFSYDKLKIHSNNKGFLIATI